MHFVHHNFVFYTNAWSACRFFFWKFSSFPLGGLDFNSELNPRFMPVLMLFNSIKTFSSPYFNPTSKTIIPLYNSTLVTSTPITPYWTSWSLQFKLLHPRIYSRFPRFQVIKIIPILVSSIYDPRSNLSPVIGPVDAHLSFYLPSFWSHPPSPPVCVFPPFTPPSPNVSQFISTSLGKNFHKSIGNLDCCQLRGTCIGFHINKHEVYFPSVILISITNYIFETFPPYHHSNHDCVSHLRDIFRRKCKYSLFYYHS